MEARGGLAYVDDTCAEVLPLPVAGLMSASDADEVAQAYIKLDALAKSGAGERGKLTAPFMTLSFLALLVIPELKLSDRGLFDGRCFEFTDLFV